MQLLTRAYQYYVGSFHGLSREVWLLAAITFVNRAGSMVVPFLSLYLTQEMGLVGSSRVDLQACKLEYSIVSPK